MRFYDVLAKIVRIVLGIAPFRQTVMLVFLFTMLFVVKDFFEFLLQLLCIAAASATEYDVP